MTAPAAGAGTVLVTSRSFSSGDVDLVARLAEAGLQVVRGRPEHDLEALRQVLADAVAWVAGTGPVTAAHLDLAPRLRVLARYGVGVDAVDLAAAADRRVTVTNTPGANSEAVAEHAVALLLAVLRGVPDGDRRVRDGDWGVIRGRQLAGSAVGVVGFGRIGRGVADRVRGLGCTVLVHDPYVGDEDVRAAGHTPSALEQLARDADAVSLHAPGGLTLLDRAWVKTCRPGQVVVNTARADLVDEDAVAEALRSGRLAGYAADTLTTEAAAHPGGTSALLDPRLADRVVLTPHLGGQTTEAVDLMGSMAVDAVLDVLAGRPPAYPVLPPATTTDPHLTGADR
ncbi:NAD(P)-dependent oxidoreductase [Ornithinimicrobium sediminis]|uniref:NAD(P)-dependent oxidoreductase n=1 Tax=Ornithinimicrobium sediminis TaxID=2904603 RepID=UPI001E31E307|nr:NAD(P)-dependent oxidoreductase [Ornithinimicrobium sediminis]MCE0487386.1 hydroxyacid dehydrogenase [Ornithinimicrobium sediminis]